LVAIVGDTYTKLFRSILQSTIWKESKETKLVWVTMLALCDEDGEVHASVPGLATSAGVTIDECVEALRVLSSPDPWSRSKNDEGRRIRETPGGWILINYHAHRQRMSIEERRERARERKQRQRARERAQRCEIADQSLSVTSPVTRARDACDLSRKSQQTEQNKIEQNQNRDPTREQQAKELTGTPDLEASLSLAVKEKSKEQERNSIRQASTRARARAREEQAEDATYVALTASFGSEHEHPDSWFTDRTSPIERGSYVPAKWVVDTALASGIGAEIIQATLMRYRERSKLTVAAQSAHDKAFTGWLKNHQAQFDTSSAHTSQYGTPSTQNATALPRALDPASPEYHASLTPETHPEHFAGMARKSPWSKT
jgi:hypothetical protein